MLLLDNESKRVFRKNLHGSLPTGLEKHMVYSNALGKIQKRPNHQNTPQTSNRPPSQTEAQRGMETLPSSQNITEYHRMFGVGRDLCGSSSPTPLPKQGHLQQAAQDLSRLDISPSLLVNIFSTVLTRQGSAYAEVEHPTPSPTGALLPRRCEGGRRGIGVRGEHPSPRCSRRACVLHGSQPASRAEAHTGKPRWINA